VAVSIESAGEAPSGRALNSMTPTRFEPGPLLGTVTQSGVRPDAASRMQHDQ
jgi:hypothetical protein